MSRPEDPFDDSKIPSVVQSMTTQITLDSLDYASQCYGAKDVDQIEACNVFSRATLPYVVNKSAECPFSENMCRSSSDNLHLDSGYLNVHKDLGLNEGPSLYFRVTRQCAPLVTKGFHQLYRDKENPALRLHRYDYGGYVSGNRTFTHQILQVDNSSLVLSSSIAAPGRTDADYHIE